MHFDVLPNIVLITLLTFCRVGTVFMFLPGLGETNIPTNVRVIVAVLISLLVAPLIPAAEIKTNSSPSYLAFIMTAEIFIGVAIGMMTKLLIASVHVLGLSIGTYSGLSSVLLFDPSQGAQGSIFGNFFTLVTIACILAADLHLFIISGVVHSYEKFPLASFYQHFSDFSELITEAVTMTFNVGVLISAPFILVSITLSVALGVIAKLIPQIQVFFIMLPAQIIITFILLLATFAGITSWFVNHYHEQLLLLFKG